MVGSSIWLENANLFDILRCLTESTTAALGTQELYILTKSLRKPFLEINI